MKESKKRSLRLYRSIDFLPLWNFWKIIADNDNKYLVIKNRHDYEEFETDLDLDGLWLDIYDKYIDESNDHKNQKVKVLKGKLNNQWGKYIEERAWLSLLSLSCQIGVKTVGQKDCEEIAGKLNERGYKISNDGWEEYVRSISVSAKRVSHNVSFMEKFSNQIKRELDNDGGVFKNPYNDMIARCKDNGYNVGYKTTVGEYLAIDKRIKAKENASVKPR